LPRLARSEDIIARPQAKINVVQFHMHCKPKAIGGGTVASTLRSRDVFKGGAKLKEGKFAKALIIQVRVVRSIGT